MASKDPLSLDVLGDDVAGQRASDHDQEPVPEPRRLRRYQLDGGLEQVSQSEPGARPDQGPDTVQQDEPAPADAHDARQWRSDRAEAGQELRDEQGPPAVPHEEVLGPSYAVIGLQRHAAEHAQHPASPPATELV